MDWEMGQPRNQDFQQMKLPSHIGKAHGKESVDWVFVAAVILIVATL